jgi:CDP-6-deoxy-D-xylo-4-hexulose-3-dehydrase
VNEIQYPLASSTWGLEEQEAAIKCILSGNLTMGVKVKEFEKIFADKLGSQFAVMVNSGSSANLLMLSALKYSELLEPSKNEIIVPAVSWSTTYFPISQNNFKLKFVDVDLNSLNLDVDVVRDAITPNTAAVFAVNILGQPCDLSRLSKLCQENNILLLEDNCESLGSKIDNRFGGTWGIMGSFSFFYSHHISTMEGGMICTDDQYFYEILLSLRAHGWLRDLPIDGLNFPRSGDEWIDKFNFVLPGYNLRPLEIEAAVGIEQLKKLDVFIEKRHINRLNFEIIAEKYKDRMKIQRGIGVSSNFGFSIILTGVWENLRPTLIKLLNKNGIESRPVIAGNFVNNPVIKFLNYEIFGELKNADYIHKNGLYIGNHHFEMENEFSALIAALEEMN